MVARRTLVLEAGQAAADARDATGNDQVSPIDVYDVALQLGLRVQFVDASMEGVYVKTQPPRVMLSSQRPLGRRAYTCAHEIGHHVFGHGSTIDQLIEDERESSDQPNEIIAEAFAGFLLMPTIGVRGAFARRGIIAETASREQMFTVATEFGVGYATLVWHLSRTVRDLSETRRRFLLAKTPKQIREAILPSLETSWLALVDQHSSNATLDLEVGNHIALPPGSKVSGQALVLADDLTDLRLFKATARGTSTVLLGGRTLAVRIAPKNFVGRAIYRHLEDPDD